DQSTSSPSPCEPIFWPSHIIALALAYFFAFGASALALPLATEALLNGGFAASVIGSAVALRGILQMLLTPFWAGAADRMRRAQRLTLVVQCGLIVAMAVLAYAPGESAVLLLLGYALFGILGPSSTLLDGLTLRHLVDRHHGFGALRLFGTLGYGVI